MFAGDVRRRICPHCSKSVSVKTYKAHRRLFYDFSEDRWLLSNSSGAIETDVGTDDEAPPSSFGEICEGLDICTDSAPSINYDLGKIEAK